MASKQPSTTTQISKVELPKWVEQASEENFRFAQQIANKPYNPYTGQTVADQSKTTTDAYNYFKNNLSAGQSDIDKASGLFGKAGQGILGLDRSAYMNPFIDEVESKALSALDKQRVQALMGNADAATAAKAFGGSRHGVVDAITNAETAEKAGLLSSNLRKDAFDTASGLMQGDIQSMLSSGQGLLSSGAAAQDARNKNFASLLGIGQSEQEQAQRKLDDQYNRWQEAENYDVERLNILLSALGMSPYGKSESTVKETKGGSSGMDFGSLGLGLLSIFMGMSDERQKTDIKKVGVNKETGIPIYSYRYKGDPKTYPKVVGPMAQDVEKVFPDAVAEIDGVKMVDKRVLGALSHA